MDKTQTTNAREILRQENASLLFKLDQKTELHNQAMNFLAERNLVGDFVEWIKEQIQKGTIK